MTNKPRAAGKPSRKEENMRLNTEDYIKKMWKEYGIIIHEHGEFQGFIKRKVYYEIFIPRTDTEKISYITDDCSLYTVSSAHELQPYLNGILRSMPERAKKLKEAMQETMQN